MFADIYWSELPMEDVFHLQWSPPWGLPPITVLYMESAGRPLGMLVELPGCRSTCFACWCAGSWAKTYLGPPLPMMTVPWASFSFLKALL